MTRVEPLGEMESLGAQLNGRVPWEEEPDRQPGRKKSAGKKSAAAVILLALLKAGGSILRDAPVLTHLIPVGAMALSMLVMLLLYARLFTWAFAVGLVALLFVHEMGHYLAAAYYGVEVSLPLFIPFFGAVIRMKKQPQSVETEAKIALAGPLFGSLGALLFLLVYLWGGKPYGLAFAYLGFVLNLFNLIPVYPLDGGRVACAISPRLWLIGIPVCVVVLFFSFNPLLLLILIPGFFQMMARFKDAGRTCSRVDPFVRGGLAAAYFGLSLFLALGILYAQSVSRSIGM